MFLSVYLVLALLKGSVFSVILCDISIKQNEFTTSWFSQQQTTWSLASIAGTVGYLPNSLPCPYFFLAQEP